MTSPYYHLIKGSFVIQNYSPDGDSVRFIADDPDLYTNLYNYHRIRPSRRDESVQLRFEGVDATELHYGSEAQPLGKEARDQLLSWIGFGNIEFKSETSEIVESASPDSIRGAILSQAAETNGRPVSYVLLDADIPKGRDWVRVEEKLLRKTLNFRLLDTGMAYYTVYTSMPAGHRKFFKKVATAAWKSKKGVWALDTTSGFILDGQDSIGPDGQCILPKLFRRCTDYLKDQVKGFNGNLADWLLWVSKSKSRNENDLVLIRDSIEVPLSELLDQRNRTIVFNADILDIVFVEK